MNVNKKQNGIERPTSNPTLRPIDATTTTIIKRIAPRIFPSSSETICSVITVSSSVIKMSRFGGSFCLRSFNTSVIESLVSKALAPSLKNISNATVSFPLMRAYSLKSLNVRFTVAMSPNVITASFVTFTGMLYTSLGVSKTLGTSTLKLPRPVSCLPPGITILLLLIEL